MISYILKKGRKSGLNIMKFIIVYIILAALLGGSAVGYKAMQTNNESQLESRPLVNVQCIQDNLGNLVAPPGALCIQETDNGTVYKMPPMPIPPE